MSGWLEKPNGRRRVHRTLTEIVTLDGASDLVALLIRDAEPDEEVGGE